MIEMTCDTVYPTISDSVQTELNAYVDTTMLWLLDKLGDNNVRIRRRAMETLEALMHSPAIGVFPLVEKITQGEVKATTATSHRHTLGRNTLLSTIV